MITNAFQHKLLILSKHVWNVILIRIHCRLRFGQEKHGQYVSTRTQTQLLPCSLFLAIQEHTNRRLGPCSLHLEITPCGCHRTRWKFASKGEGCFRKSNVEIAYVRTKSQKQPQKCVLFCMVYRSRICAIYRAGSRTDLLPSWFGLEEILILFSNS